MIKSVMSSRGNLPLPPPSDASSSESSDDPSVDDYYRLLDALPDPPLDSPLLKYHKGQTFDQKKAKRVVIGGTSLMHSDPPKDGDRKKRKDTEDDNSRLRSHSDHGQRRHSRSRSRKTRNHVSVTPNSRRSSAARSVAYLSTEYTSNTSGLSRLDERVGEMFGELRREQDRLFIEYQEQPDPTKDAAADEDGDNDGSYKSKGERSFSPRHILRKMKKKLRKSNEKSKSIPGNSPKSPQGVDSPITPRGSRLKRNSDHSANVSPRPSSPSKSRTAAQEASPKTMKSRSQSPTEHRSQSHLSNIGKSHSSISPGRQHRSRRDDSTHGKRKHRNHHSLSPKMSRRMVSRNRHHSASPQRSVRNGEKHLRERNRSHRSNRRSLSPANMGRSSGSRAWSSTHSSSSRQRSHYVSPDSPLDRSVSSRGNRRMTKSRSLPSAISSRRERQQRKHHSPQNSTRRSTSTQTDSSMFYSMQPTICPSSFLSDLDADQRLSNDSNAPSSLRIVRKPSKASGIRPSSEARPSTRPTASAYRRSPRGKQNQQSMSPSLHSHSKKSAGSSSRSARTRSSRSRSSPRRDTSGTSSKVRLKRDFTDAIDWRSLSPQIHEGKFLRPSAKEKASDESIATTTNRLLETDVTLKMVRKWCRKQNGDPYRQNSFHFHDSYPSLGSKSFHSSMSRLSLHDVVGRSNTAYMEQAKHRNELRRSNSLRNDLNQASSVPKSSSELSLDVFQF